MELSACIANALWTASNVASYARFRHALSDPARAQRAKLRRLVAKNSDTAFGRAHDFGSITCYQDFVRRVPLCDYSELEPWIARIKNGGQSLLTAGPVKRLVPTSGSSGARKLIPFAGELQREFNSAIGPWLVDLAREFPAIAAGPAYWSITPAFATQQAEESMVPIGFDSDTEYLSGLRSRLANAIMAAPPSIGRSKSLADFHCETWFHLLRAGELRLISVWHPSFLTLLLDALPPLWEDLLKRMRRASVSRARELAAADPNIPRTFWPKLRVISCWGDANARDPMAAIQRRFPGVAIQPKGLLATEGIVTLPFQNAFPLAITSHFFEFIDSSGAVSTAEELRVGEEYQVVLTTGGGLWRYRLGDRVRVTGFLRRTPTLEFVGRGDEVSDCCGEKLSERFVGETLRELFGFEAPPFAMLAPDAVGASWQYTLFVEGAASLAAAQKLDALLRRNPHYANCRDLGQLLPPQVRLIRRGFETYTLRSSGNGARIGDIKPRCLSALPNWLEVFNSAETVPSSLFLSR